MDTELLKRVLILFFFVLMLLCSGWIACDAYRNSFPPPQKVEQFVDKDRSVMILNLGIAIGYLSSKTGIDEKLLYSEGMRMYNLMAPPPVTEGGKK